MGRDGDCWWMLHDDRDGALDSLMDVDCLMTAWNDPWVVEGGDARN